MIRKVEEYVKEQHMLEEHDKVIAGVSGGADSVCLLFMLLEMKKSLDFDIVVVHVNHGLRKEAADRDEEYVKELCEKHGLPCEIYREDVELIAKKRKESLEEAGRNVRREAFFQTLEKYCGTKIALAHHKNDNVETMLMNLARGTGLKGLGGIRPVNGVVIRPLLCLERREIETWLGEQGISYCTDETNSSGDYTRNRVRNQVIPALSQGVNEKAVSHMADTIEQLREVSDYVQSEIAKRFEGTVRKLDYGYLLREEPYAELPDIMQGGMIIEVMKAASGKERDISAAHVAGVKKLMANQPGRKVNLPYGLTARRGYEGVEIAGEPVRVQKKVCVTLDFDREEPVRAGDAVVFLKILESGGYKEEKTYTKCFDYDIIKDTVKVRTRAPGDYITIDRKGRKQKLKSYFINEKIPAEERDSILLLAEGSHILWVIGYRRGCSHYIGPDTERILEITIDKGESKDGRENQSTGIRAGRGCED